MQVSPGRKPRDRSQRNEGRRSDRGGNAITALDFTPDSHRLQPLTGRVRQSARSSLRGRMAIVPIRLITYVLLLAYGVPASVGNGMHALQAALASDGGCSCCHHATSPSLARALESGRCSIADGAADKDACSAHSNPQADAVPTSRAEPAPPEPDADAESDPSAPDWKRSNAGEHDPSSCPVCRYLAGSLSLPVADEPGDWSARLCTLDAVQTIAVSRPLARWTLARGPPSA